MRILAPPGVFHPRSDTWMLAGAMRAERPLAGSSVLDVCTGSGALAMAAARAGASEVTAVDSSRRAVLAARLNARVNRVRVRALRGDLFGPVQERRFDTIVSNPPYRVVARHRGPLGPLLAERAAELEARGLLSPGEREEELVAIGDRLPAGP